MSDFTIAILIVLGLLAAYRLGYHNGAAYCIRQIKLLENAARELAAMTRCK